MTEDEMVGWHQLDGLQFKLALGAGDGQGNLASCCPWDHKESNMIQQLKNNNPSVHRSTIYNSQDMEKTLMSMD